MVLIINNYYYYVYCTISEYAAKGCLYDHLANNKLNFEQILRWSTEIALGKQVSVYISDSELDVHVLCSCTQLTVDCRKTCIRHSAGAINHKKQAQC